MKTIIKRSMAEERYSGDKIVKAMEKAFISVGVEHDADLIADLLRQVEAEFADREQAGVEEIQDAVERVMMANGCFDAAKSYILYREKRAEMRKIREALVAEIRDENLLPVLASIQSSYEHYDLTRLEAKYIAMQKPDSTIDARLELLTKSAAELTTQEEPNWEKIAGRLLYYTFSRELKKTEENYGLTSFYEKLRYLTSEGLYGKYILDSYSKKEIEEAFEFIDDERNNLYTYAGLDLLISRYLIHNRSHVVLESPQEMYLGIALHLALKEGEDRMTWVRKFYDIMSLQKVTMATPTQSNARKPYHQLSSCFIDTVPDSLDGIYSSVSKFADVSKFGGGMGMYFGKVRSRGGSIRGFEGASGGVIRWIRVVNDTAVAVDQLGMRQGAVAVYLDAWHKDLPEFLQLRTNNGDDRMKAHDVFPAVCYPDLFWRLAKENLNQDWYLMDPHDIMQIKGYCLEDSFGEEWEKRYWDCVNDVRISKRVIGLKELVKLILKSAVETGTPFAFYRDTVNRMNPNKHKGMIYCSNLCTEIAQNMSEAEIVSTTVETHEGDEVIVTRTKPGDFVVCNLASLCLGNINVHDNKELEDITSTVIRALDNVIDLNFYPINDAKLTNQKYRAIGLGVSGYHHMLAKNRIKWESEEHLAFADKVFEDIGYAAVKASNELAKERGSYSLFEGSEWQDGKYFDRREYNSERWQKLKASVAENGIRNAWIMATAPTSSTSILIGTTAGLDPVMNRFFLEEKKGAILPRVAPELSMATYWYYKQAHYIDQTWSVRAAGIRQRHIDQAQSFNFWITNDYKMSQLLNLYILAWEEGVKTVYYVRSKALDPEDCDSCSA
ncbi:MAG: ribonucleoside-diphosphate reductase subunit alpha [[Eubacterium] sulci]|nr:ribonucleoside-diphosphate reductase subunit alpha [[Eubacterium] sulci]MBF1162632.1 ribonucleoside-diphosphate reductase subunit alpha [[Eubacterium] sulci]MBF1181898.1 ribonucleoside-diphosphate reductase subunit alpha [[Eubacterium] sulci]